MHFKIKMFKMKFESLSHIMYSAFTARKVERLFPIDSRLKDQYII